MVTTTAWTFSDWDIAARKPVEKDFPAGTEVTPIDKMTFSRNPKMKKRTYRIVGLDGWTAIIPLAYVK